VDFKSLYNCTIGRPIIAELTVVSLAIRLKVKYHMQDGVVTTFHIDIEALMRCFMVANKSQSLVSLAKTMMRGEKKGKAKEMKRGVCEATLL
jgi:hypothetical protein